MNFDFNASHLIISPWSYESIASGFLALNVNLLHNATSNAYISANLAIYVPFVISSRIIATQMFTVNGATAGNNIDVGIYTADGTRLVSIGSTAQSGTATIQAFNITDTELGPGLYYMAIAMNGTTGTLYSSLPTARALRAMGCFNQATAFALPATATFASVANAYIPVFGLTTRSFL
jgi:hypothetical protein